jgi:hypothetical protein
VDQGRRRSAERLATLDEKLPGLLKEGNKRFSEIIVENQNVLSKMRQRKSG